MDIRTKVLRELEHIDYVSFDLYDTLLLRLARRPSNIFEKTYELKPTLFPEYMCAADWCAVRVWAEQSARKKCPDREIRFSEIYDELPQIIQNRDAIEENEIRCEVQSGVLNPEIVGLLYEVAEQHHKKIILTSDMYLPREVLTRILTENGMRLEVIDRIFVSSESRLTKRSGKLYGFICDELGCLPQKILHIGDNRKADFLQARRMGLRAICYPMMPEATVQQSYLVYEAEHYGDPCREIYPIRILAAQNEYTGRARFWYETGAMVMGPLLTAASDWVLDVAEQNHIRQIFPMMREGRFLTRLLETAQRERGWRGKIVPMYISREALYPAILPVLKEKDVQYIFSTRWMRVGKLVSLLCKEELPAWERYADLPLHEAKHVYDGNETVYAKLERRFFNAEALEKLRNTNRDADILLWSYLQSLGMADEDYITFDVGWRGNAQNAIARIMRNRHAKTKGIHLLVNGKKSILREQNLEDAADIRGFSANFGGGEEFLKDVFIPLFELFLMCEEGTTKGYEWSGEQVRPVLKEIPYLPSQLEMMQYAQQGILAFQHTYYQICRAKGHRLKQSPVETLMIASRLTAYPTRKEAVSVGDLQCDQNFSVDEKWRIISQKQLDMYQQEGYNAFVHRNAAREDEWYQGMDACIDGLHFYKQLLFARRNGPLFQCGMFTERICCRFQRFALVGVGKQFRNIMMFLNMLGEAGRVECVLDNDPIQWESELFGKTAEPLSTEVPSQCFVLTVAGKQAIKSLTGQLKQMHGTDIEIFHMYS